MLGLEEIRRLNSAKVQTPRRTPRAPGRFIIRVDSPRRRSACYLTRAGRFVTDPTVAHSYHSEAFAWGRAADITTHLALDDVADVVLLPGGES